MFFFFLETNTHTQGRGKNVLTQKHTTLLRGGARIFCLGGPNFVTNILVSSQDKPSHSGINAHTQI